MEWGVDPVYIMDHWTEELLTLMTTKMVERKKHEAEPPNPNAGIRDMIGPEARLLPGVEYIDKRESD